MRLDPALSELLIPFGVVAAVVAYGGYSLGSGARQLAQRRIAGLWPLLRAMFVLSALLLINSLRQPPLGTLLSMALWGAVFVLGFLVAVTFEPWLYEVLGYQTAMELGGGLLFLMAGVAYFVLAPQRTTDQLVGVAVMFLLGGSLVLSAIKRAASS